MLGAERRRGMPTERDRDEKLAELSELSHEEPAWDVVVEGETIPFEAAFLSRGRPGAKALQRARELAHQYHA